MNNGSGVSRGDRNRNARLSRLRAAVPVTNAIVGIDLADRKQMVVGDATTTPRSCPGARSRSRPGTSVRRWTGPPTGPGGPGLRG